jgi:hypothetical protein
LSSEYAAILILPFQFIIYLVKAGIKIEN